MHEWSEGFWAAVGIIVCSVLVVILINFMNIGRQTAGLVYADRAITEEMQEYLRFNNYDGTIVYSQDVTSVILEYRGNPYVKVILDNGRTHNWNSTDNNPSEEYTSASISSIVPVASKYLATLDVDDNGVVVGFIFKEVT